MGRSDRGRAQLADVRSFIGELYGAEQHTKRIASLAGATLGVMHAASLAVAMIGQALAQARGLVTKQAVKQVDRMLSNPGIDVWDSFARWVPHQIGERQDLLVAMDWTDFDHDDQATLVLSLVTGHGRAAPLLWLSVWKDELTKQRNDFEDACLRRLAELIPPGRRVTILADRGFGDQKLFAFLATLGFGYVIRFRGNIHVTGTDGQTRPASAWVGKGGRARKLLDARVTAQGQQVGAVVCVHAKDMKEPWCLASSDRDATAATLINHYARRWTRAAIPRHEGFALRHGPVCHAHQRADASRPPAADQRVRHRSADAAGQRRREPRHGSPAEVKHQQDADAFAVPSGMHALRTHPQHAGTPPPAADAEVRRGRGRRPRLRAGIGSRKMRG
jgi:Transposase DDE domain